MIDIRHPEVHIQLTGEDGNGFSAMSALSQDPRAQT
jgi:hypothetical protein